MKPKMDVEHEDKDLEDLEFDASATGGFGDQALVKAFRKVMGWIRGAADERDFYALKSLHYEKLQGSQTDRSMRLNNQWRLIVEIRGKGKHKRVVVKHITDYH